jgi:hypothetical protein
MPIRRNPGSCCCGGVKCYINHYNYFWYDKDREEKDKRDKEKLEKRVRTVTYEPGKPIGDYESPFKTTGTQPLDAAINLTQEENIKKETIKPADASVNMSREERIKKIREGI